MRRARFQNLDAINSRCWNRVDIHKGVADVLGETISCQAATVNEYQCVLGTKTAQTDARCARRKAVHAAGFIEAVALVDRQAAKYFSDGVATGCGDFIAGDDQHGSDRFSIDTLDVGAGNFNFFDFLRSRGLRLGKRHWRYD